MVSLFKAIELTNIRLLQRDLMSKCGASGSSSLVLIPKFICLEMRVVSPFETLASFPNASENLQTDALDLKRPPKVATFTLMIGLSLVNHFILQIQRAHVHHALGKGLATR